MEPSAAPSSLWTHAASFVPVESMLMLDQKVLFGADLSSTKRAPESEEYQMLPYQAAAATAVPSDLCGNQVRSRSRPTTPRRRDPVCGVDATPLFRPTTPDATPFFGGVDPVSVSTRRLTTWLEPPSRTFRRWTCP